MEVIQTVFRTDKAESLLETTQLATAATTAAISPYLNASAGAANPLFFETKSRPNTKVPAANTKKLELMANRNRT